MHEGKRKMKVLRVTMPDGSVWEVPARIVAEDRAKYYSKKREENYHEVFKETMDDDFEIKDWASNNMNWDDVKELAKKVQDLPKVDYQEGWVNGEKEVLDI